jgi:riboflavin synthase
VTAAENAVVFEIEASRVLEGLAVGASIAVDGVCQTVLQTSSKGFRVAAEMETLRATTLGRLQPGGRLNLERALAVNGRLDGHLLLGHVDARGMVRGVRREARTLILELEAPPEMRPYVAPKGCIGVDGVSLTVGPEVGHGRFAVYLIPHTWEQTTLAERRVGDAVNLEADVLARYVVHLLQSGLLAAGRDGEPSEGVTWESLATLLEGRPGDST